MIIFIRKYFSAKKRQRRRFVLSFFVLGMSEKDSAVCRRDIQWLRPCFPLFFVCRLPAGFLLLRGFRPLCSAPFRFAYLLNGLAAFFFASARSFKAFSRIFSRTFVFSRLRVDLIFSMRLLMPLSIRRSWSYWRAFTKVIASPECPARPVRPILWI